MSNWFETKTIWKRKIKELEAIKCKVERVVGFLGAASPAGDL